MDEKKSMNTHLHMLEAYANLLFAWNDEHVATAAARTDRAYFLTTSSIPRVITS